MSNPIVSIIMPNYNYSDFIASAIESVRAQTLKDWECIIIDDNSSDNSVAVIKSLIRSDNRFKLIVNEKTIGVSATRNIGLDMATGEYIAFLDSDDCYTEYFLEMLVELARKTCVGVVGAKTKFVDGYFEFKPCNTKYNINNYTVYDDYVKMLEAKQDYKWIWIWRRIYKRSLLDNVRFNNDMKINGDDITFMLDFIWRVKKVIETDDVGVYHRIHPISITSEYNDFNIERVNIFPVLFKHIHDNLINKYDKKFLRKLYLKLFAYMISECLIKTNGKLSNEQYMRVRHLLSKSCKLIPGKYLPIKQRILRRYLSWL